MFPPASNPKPAMQASDASHKYKQSQPPALSS